MQTVYGANSLRCKQFTVQAVLRCKQLWRGFSIHSHHTTTLDFILTITLNRHADFFGYEDDAKTNLSTAGCTEAIFSGANLTQANLQLASCHNANFSGANLAGREFYVNTELPNIKYEGGVVCLGTYNGANFQNVVNFTAHEMRYTQDVNIQTQISFKECRGVDKCST